MNEFRVLSPTAILGYGFPVESFKAGMKLKPHVIAVDAGSTDPGPYYLGSGKSFTDRGAVKRDLEFMLEAACANKIPVIVGSAGGSGAKSHLDWTVDIVQEISREKKLSFKLAVIPAHIKKEIIHKKFDDGKLKTYFPAPAPTKEDIDESVNIVGQMGDEPIVKALNEGAEVIIAGRAYDPTVFAALGIIHGFNKGLALHMGKILECAAIAATPGSGSDCMFGFLREDHFELTVLNKIRTCTPTSIAAHTLYEKSNPTKLPGPGGILDLTETTFEQGPGDSVIVRGSKFIPDEKYSVKLEAAKRVGYRTVSFAAVVDPIMIKKINDITRVVKERVKDNFSNLGEFFLDFKVYGQSGASLFKTESNEAALEIAIIIEAVADSPEKADTICSFARSTLLHYGYEGRISTAGNLAFPFSPSDFRGGEVFEFSLYTLMEVDDPCELFPITHYFCDMGELT